MKNKSIACLGLLLLFIVSVTFNLVLCPFAIVLILGWIGITISYWKALFIWVFITLVLKLYAR